MSTPTTSASFHGLLGDTDPDTLSGLSSTDEVPYVLRLIEVGGLSASLLEVGHAVTTWPQLAGDVTLGAGAIAEAVRRIGPGEPLSSGRTRLDATAALDRIHTPGIDALPPAATSPPIHAVGSKPRIGSRPWWQQRCIAPAPSDVALAGQYDAMMRRGTNRRRGDGTALSTDTRDGLVATAQEAGARLRLVTARDEIATFELELVAGGVETQAAAVTLLRHGCHRAQGFLPSRPLSGSDMASLLAKGRIPMHISATPTL